jgi:acyl carrier protein
MDEKQIFEEMVKILEPYVKDSVLLKNATKDTHILDDLKVNSARLVDVIIMCEDVFDIEVDDDDADGIKTIGNAVTIIERKLH